MKQVGLVLVGIGGYGTNYVHFVRDLLEAGSCDIRVEGIVDPFADRAADWGWVQSMGFPVYRTQEEFYAERSADLAMISTPIPLHRDQCICAMEHGSHVLVEKPLCPTLQDARLLEEASRRTGRFLAVGFQWSFSHPMLELKADIMSGKLGRPLYMKGFVSWKRYSRYYTGTWKGKYRTAQGDWILDSVITNATAHYLHNLFFVAGAGLPEGASLGASAMPERVLAESYRVKRDMETPDIFALRGTLPGGVPFWFSSSYSLSGEKATSFEYAYENAVVRFNVDENDDVMRAHFTDGTTKVYGDPQCWDEVCRKMEVCVRAAALNDPSGITCGIQTILPHLTVTDAMFDLIPDHPVPERYLVWEEENPGQPDTDRGLFAHTLRDGLVLGCAQNRLPSELGYSWASPAVEFVPGEITRFEGSRFV